MALPAFPPLHPVLVHIPIVLIPLSALLATLGVVWKMDWAWRAMVLVLALAAVGAVAAAVTGDSLKDAREGRDPGAAGYPGAAPSNGTTSGGATSNGATSTGNAFGGRVRGGDPTLSTHENLGTIVEWATPILAVLVLWRRDRIRATPWGLMLVGALWVAAAVVLAAGWYGGALVWDRPSGSGFQRP